MGLLLLFTKYSGIAVTPPVILAGSNDIVNISTALRQKLLAISRLNDVYEYEIDKPKLGKYPFATVTLQNFESDFGDTMRNLRRYQFAVKVYQERTPGGKDSETAERITRETIDEIKVALNQDVTLSGVVKWIRPFSTRTSYTERETGETRMVEMTIEAINTTTAYQVDPPTMVTGNITQAQISTAIKDKVDEMGRLNDLYEYEIDKPKSGKYPFATITVSEFEGEFGSTNKNIQKQTYSVKIYQERTPGGKGSETAERIMRETLDEMITAFDRDPTLSGLVKVMRPIGGSVGYIEREAGETRMVEVLLEATTVVDSS